LFHNPELYQYLSKSSRRMCLIGFPGPPLVMLAPARAVTLQAFSLHHDIWLAPLISAELYSAVSQSCTLRGAGKGRRMGPIRRPAEYNSGIRQIENLRCEGALIPSGAASERCVGAWFAKRGVRLRDQPDRVRRVQRVVADVHGHP